MERFGLVGLPNAGKSSLFNALTNAGALAAPYAFATKEPNVGVSKVPDHRLDDLAAMSKSKNVVAATVQVVDIGGLVEGASKGEGLGNRFLGGIREVDAIVFVLRAFARRRRARARRPARAPAGRRDRAGAGRPRDGGGPARPGPEGGAGRSVAGRRGRRPRRRLPGAERRARRSTGPASTPPGASCSSPTTSSPTSRCWPW